VDAVFEGKAISPREYDMKFRTKSPQTPVEPTRPKPTVLHGNNSVHGTHTDAGVSVLCPSPATIPFDVDSVVEVVAGLRKGQRGVVRGEARSSYRGVADLVVRFEDGVVRWIGPEMLRRLG
jgi:hypothetical protein